MKCGDILKLKIRGMKKKYRILCPTDVITEDCLQQYVTDNVPLCYETVINMAHFNDPWSSTTCAGDMVCDNHCGRVYIEPVK